LNLASGFQFQISDFKFASGDLRLQISDFRPAPSYFQFQISDFNFASGELRLSQSAIEFILSTGSADNRSGGVWAARERSACDP
jgi:hypothetical protein